jgi:acetyltransferase-like isoleucine patch superfamily enzyme
MSDAFAVRIPHEFVNDDTVKLLRWVVEDGQEVREGQTLAEIETSKALVELAAGATGKISQKRKPGEELRVGEIVGFISSNGISSATFESVVEAATHHGAPVQHGGDSEKLPTDTRFSKKALGLLQVNALSPSLFSGRGLVREQDVIEHLKKGHEIEGQATVTHFALGGISLDRVTLPAAFSDFERGKIDPDFYMQLRKDPNSFAKLSSDEKCETYRKHGAVIGDGILLDAGSIVIAPQIEIGNRVQIGSNSSIQCRERFVAGQLTSFRSGLTIRGGTVVLGENIFAGGNVQIGGGGNGDPYAVLGVGDGTYIGDDVFINICRPVLIGREVFLTQRSILVTHNIGHSVLEGYENRFAPIVLEDYAQVGMNSTVYAGSRIGRGSIVMSNSYVVSSIPPDKLAAGVPARVIREAKRPIDRKRQIEIVHEMMGEYHELLTLKGHTVSSFQREPLPTFDVQRDGKRFRLSFIETLSDGSFQPEPGDESIIWTLNDSGENIPEASTVIDLLAKRFSGGGGVFAETTREFLRKRGIRLEPGPWRYSGGLI